MKLYLSIATHDDVPAIVALKNEAAQALTTSHGKGHWSYQCTDKGVLHSMKGNSKILIAKHRGQVVGSLLLTEKKPWAIDTAYFTKVVKALYLLDMTVHPASQCKGVGRYMMQKIKPFVVAWPAQAVRLDAYDNAAGAGDFYRKCGYTETGRVVYKNTPLIYFECLI